MPVDPGEPVATTVCYFLHTGCGCIGHPAFPAPSVFRGKTVRQNSGVAPREREGMFEVGSHVRSERMFEVMCDEECRPPARSSSSATADDPEYSRDASDRTEEPRRTGYPACAGGRRLCLG